MRSFAYRAPATAEAALAELAGDPGAVYLAGGTNLVDLMRLGVARPRALVDLNGLLPHSVEETDAGGLLIGAGVRNSDLAAEPRVRRDYPVLSQALLSGASGQLRNMATVGGNLLQRTRCLYFQDVTKPCNKREPGSGCPAREGIHRDLGILGVSTHCIATNPSDMAVALAALDAVIHLDGVDGRRRVTLDELYRLPGDDPTRDTTLGRGELITAVELPAPSRLTRTSAYRKARDRRSYAFAVGAVAAAVVVDDGEVSEVRIALGAVAPRPWRARVAESALRGQALGLQAVKRAVAHEMERAELLPDNAFKAVLSANLTADVLIRLAGLDGEER
ncbi:MAG: xanthine dehydrogenase YagS FAD-binding subunit [Nocardioidaceae bacterium]|nr:xanthine dehydrogenase YagS FAD-binding subunit [Nocardioidaceae bacterium]